jgi:hypothetical protein
MRNLPTRFAAFGEMPADRKCNELGAGRAMHRPSLLKFVAGLKSKKSAGVKPDSLVSAFERYAMLR